MITIETVKVSNRSKCKDCNWFTDKVSYIPKGQKRYIVLTPYMFNARPQADRVVLCEKHGEQTVRIRFKELKGLVYGF